MESKGYRELPEEVQQAMALLQVELRLLQGQMNAMLFGIRKTMKVPDNWQFDGKGFKEPEEPKKEEAKP